MIYDRAPEIASPVARHGFHAAEVRMKTAHHDRIPELAITRERMFS